MALGPTGHHRHRRDGSEQLPNGRNLGGRSGNDDRPHRGSGGDPPDRVHQQRLAGQQTQRLRPTRAEPKPRTRSRNKDRDVTPSIKLRGHVAVLCRDSVVEALIRPR
ncbi:hypothetical protein Adu01nite_71580 [Paractinoplanes durhamensis]|uniref:Uncharacterized protein n=1 Tax=Paractinoplanes durhamensis TaxID=113563 RepID=A0ABQ3Z7J4_9ACTN|nr:hypothetical protein Adu01nite_71580 [Actinoplanes durhamensis]